MFASRTLRLALLTFVAPIALHAQVVGGTLACTVTDPTGAVVANANVLVHTDDTGAQRALTTSATGTFSAPASAIVQLPGDLESLEKAKARRPPFRFPMVGIMPGEELSFYNEPEIESYVVDDKNVKFEDQIMSLGKAAGIVLTRMGKSDAVAGTDYWTKDGTTLWDLRNQAEESNND